MLTTILNSATWSEDSMFKNDYLRVIQQEYQPIQE